MITFKVVYPEHVYMNAVLLAFIDDQIIEVPIDNEYLKTWHTCSTSMLCASYEGDREICLKGQCFILPFTVWEDLIFILLEHEAAEAMGIDEVGVH